MSDLTPRQRAFLKSYAQNCCVVKAAEDAKVHRTRHYDWLKNKNYRQAYDEARNEFADVLEAVVINRAIEGTLEPVFYKGKAVGAIRRFSDGNAQMLLRGLKPEVYRERVSAELTGKNGGPIETKSALPEWLLQQLKANNPSSGDTTPSPAKEPSTRT